MAALGRGQGLGEERGDVEDVDGADAGGDVQRQLQVHLVVLVSWFVFVYLFACVLVCGRRLVGCIR